MVETPTTILVIGYYGAGNVGDEAVLTALINGLRSGHRNLKLIVPGEDPEALASRHRLESFEPWDVERLAAALDEADAVLVGGGGLLHDYVFQDPMLMFSSRHWGLPFYCGIPWLASELGKPVMLYAVGVGPFAFSESTDMVRDLASAAAAITVRDRESQEALVELGVSRERVEITADPVWALSPSEGSDLDRVLAQEGIDGEGWLAVVVRNWPFAGDQEKWEHQLVEGLRKVAVARGLRVLFVPFQKSSYALQDDVSLAERLAAGATGFEARVAGCDGYGPEEMAGLVGACDAVVAMRFHALVFAAMTGTPAVALAYDPKVSSLASHMEPSVPCLSVEGLTSDGLTGALEDVLSKGAASGEAMKQVAIEQRAASLRTVEVALDLLRDVPPATRTPTAERTLRLMREAEKLRRERIRRGGRNPEALDTLAASPAGQTSVENPRKVRILAPAFFDFEGETMFSGGAERYLLELADLVRNMDLDVEVLQTAGDNDWERRYGDLLVHGVASGSEPARLPQVVQERGFETAALTVFLAFNQAERMRVDNTIGISHGIFWDDPIYHGEKGADPELIRRILTAIENLDTVVSVDGNTINWVRATRADLAERFVHIPNFVDLTTFYPRKRKRSDRGGVEILFPRRLSAVRGFWLLTEIVPRLLEEHPHVRFRLVGKITESWERAAILRARDQLLEKYEGRVKWDALPPERMPEAYAAADIVVVPTMASEGTSLACLEAQASGCAVLATPVGGLPEIVVDGHNGLLADPVPEVMHSALDRLIRDAGLREQLGRNAAKAAEAFSIERWRSRWRRVLRAHVALDEETPVGSGKDIRLARGGSMGERTEVAAGAESDAAGEQLVTLREELRDREAWLVRVRRRLAEERARAQVLLETVQHEVIQRERRDAEDRAAVLRQEFAVQRTRLEQQQADALSRAAKLRQELSEQGRVLEGARTEASELRHAQEELRGRHDELVGRNDEVLAKIEALREEAARLERQITTLTDENRALAWKARGVLGRAIDRLWQPRAEGRVIFFLRSGYYAVARGVTRVLGRRRVRAGTDSSLMSLYQHRFWRFKNSRENLFGATFSGMKSPSEPALVSVVLPVFNGAAMVEEAIESVLAQEYDQLELIIVDDGSTDATPQIVDAWATKDPRIRVVHQENQTLPRALSNGFRLARGEFLTWTSDDNRLKPNFLEEMVACLRRHPDWDMAYANQDIIGDDGDFLYGSEWFEGYQGPPGSPHVYLPENTGELNTWPNNYVGAAFMYRDRVLDLLGDYSPNRFTIEDYDYWMRVNELMNLRHADFEDRVADYRFHGKSLTSKEKELQILDLREELMVFDDFRRDFALSPLVWVFPESPSSQIGQSYLEDLRARAEAAGHLVGLPGGCNPALLPRLWFPVVFVAWADNPSQAAAIPDDLPRGSLTVLLTDSENLPGSMSSGWHLCATTAPTDELGRLEGSFQGWYGLPSAKIAFTALDIRARSHHLRAIEDEAYAPTAAELEASIIVCTYRRTDSLEKCLRSVAAQTVGHDRYEVLLVNNHPADDLSDLVDELREELFADRPDGLRLIVCPLKGLSFARNAGIGVARGEVLCCIDDDAVADGDWLEGILDTFQEDPRVGVVGGHILLVPPEPPPRWFRPELWGFWSHFEPGYPEVREVENWWEFPWGANWSARRSVLLKIGGFRYGYGRKGDDFGGGEEVVAAALARRIGFTVAIQPRSVVYHHVDPERFTRKDLRKTMRAGTVVNYRMQRDLYIPRWLGPKQQTGLVLKNGWRVVAPGEKTTRRQAWYGFRAEFTCLRVMLGDYWDRLRARGLG